MQRLWSHVESRRVKWRCDCVSPTCCWCSKTDLLRYNVKHRTLYSYIPAADLETKRFLLEKGFDPNLVSPDFGTPLSVSIK